MANLLVSTYPLEVMEAIKKQGYLCTRIALALNRAYQLDFPNWRICKMVDSYDERLFHPECVTEVRNYYGYTHNHQMVFHKEVSEQDYFNKPKN